MSPHAAPATEASPASVGDVFRDTYYDGKLEACTKRTIRVVRITETGIRAEVLTDVRGGPPKKRWTDISFKTLRTSYERVAS